MSGYGSDQYGAGPYGTGLGASSPPVTYFGVSNVTVMGVGWLRVFFTMPVSEVPDNNGVAQIFVPSNYVFSVRFGRANNIFASSVTPEPGVDPTYVDVYTANPMVTQGQYRLTVFNLMSVSGISIEANQ